MKLNLLLLTAAFLQVQATGYAQKGVTLSVRNVPLQKVLEEIEQQTDYVFFYDRNILKASSPVTIKVKNESVNNVLRAALENQPIAYSIDDKVIVLSIKSHNIPVVPPSDTTNRQNITGKVLDETNNPVEGASIVNLTTSKGTTSDKNGEFQLQIAEGDNMEYSFVGLKTKRVKVFSITQPLVTLLERDIKEAEAINIISTGYQDLTKERVTGSFAFIDYKALNQQVGTSILGRINGMASGVLFQNKLTSSNRQLNIEVRGLSTINGPQDPLIVLDNFPYEGNINNINPDDIESITILKDAAATSIWGTRAGNGVIVITTKKGKLNQPLKVEFNTNLMMTEKPDLGYLPQMSSYDYLKVEEMLFNNGAYNSQVGPLSKLALTEGVEILVQRKNGLISADDSLSLMNQLAAVDVRDQYNQYMYRQAITQQYNLNLRGGSGNMAWLISGSYNTSTGQLGDKWNRVNLHLENTYKPVKNLALSLGVLYTNTSSKSGRLGYGSVNQGSKAAPYTRFADETDSPLPVAVGLRDGYIDTAGGGKLLDWRYYPLEDYKHNRTENLLQDLLATLGVQYQITKTLSLDIKYQYGRQQTEGKNIQGQESYSTRNLINTFNQLNYATGVVNYIVPKGSILGMNNGLVQSQNARAQLSYNKMWNNHRVNAIGGSEIRQTRTTGNTNTVYGFNEDLLTVGNVDFRNPYPSFIDGRPQFIGSGESFNEKSYRFVSYFANAAYTYKEKYTLSGSARRDASNLFGVNTNDKWRPPFWSAGVAWDIAGENFYKVKYLPNLKLRATYGFSGNVDLSKSAQTVIYYQGVNSNSAFPQAYVDQFRNPDLRWEKVGQFNIGVDFSSKNQRINASIEYYTKKGTDLFGSALIDYTTGLRRRAIIKNVATMKGQGVDLNIHTRIFDKGFKWYAQVFFSYNQNKTVDYYMQDNLSTSFYLMGGNTISAIPGKPLYAISSYRWGGLDNMGNPQGYLNGKLSTDYNAIAQAPANLKDTPNIIYSGPATPQYFGSLGNTLMFKGVSISVNLIYKMGYYFRRPTIGYGQLFATGTGHPDFASRWQREGDELKTNIPSMIYPNNGTRDAIYQLSETTVSRADHIRLQFINITYELNSNTINRLPLQNVQVYFNIANLGVLWKVNRYGLDPDYPSSIKPEKNYSIGLRASF